MGFRRRTRSLSAACACANELDTARPSVIIIAVSIIRWTPDIGYPTFGSIIIRNRCLGLTSSTNERRPETARPEIADDFTFYACRTVLYLCCAFVVLWVLYTRTRLKRWLIKKKKIRFRRRLVRHDQFFTRRYSITGANAAGPKRRNRDFRTPSEHLPARDGVSEWSVYGFEIVSAWIQNDVCRFVTFRRRSFSKITARIRSNERYSRDVFRFMKNMRLAYPLKMRPVETVPWKMQVKLS